jgi:hypothetical protein
MASRAAPDRPHVGDVAQWLSRRRRTLLAALKRQERERAGVLPRRLRSYQRRFHMEFRGGPPRPCPLSQVEEQVAAADLVLSADYHASPRPERTHLRWLSLLARRGRPPALALEMVSSRHQRVLEAFARGTVSEIEFLRRIRFDSEWGFSWPPYRRLLRRAIRIGSPLLALDHPRRGAGVSLQARDRCAAEIVALSLERFPGRPVLAVVGEMHLAKPHLPRAVREACRRRGRRPPRIVTLFHDSEGLFFQLGLSRQEGRAPALALGGNRYCLLSSAPWVRLLAHLRWLEQQEEEHAIEAEERAAIWTARTLAALAGMAPPHRIAIPEGYTRATATAGARIASRAVDALSAACADPVLNADRRRVWIDLARCLVDPPLEPSVTGAGDGASPGACLYRDLVDGVIGLGELRRALFEPASSTQPSPSLA